jgi:hypothetical protein
MGTEVYESIVFAMRKASVTWRNPNKIDRVAFRYQWELILMELQSTLVAYPNFDLYKFAKDCLVAP